MAKRESIRRCMEKKTSEFYNCFMVELNTVKKQFDLVRRTQPNSPVLPQYAGQALAAATLLKRLERTWDALQVSDSHSIVISK